MRKTLIAVSKCLRKRIRYAFNEIADKRFALSLFTWWLGLVISIQLVWAIFSWIFPESVVGIMAVVLGIPLSLILNAFIQAFLFEGEK